jgi:TolB-like protein/Flp pilus assembly protein TadD
MSTTLHFGEFQADLGARELRKKGVRIAVQAQPFEVLTALLEQPGRLITRDALQRRIWPDVSFIDSERGLNKAVNRLRTALGDLSAEPRFVETLPKRGYRWIAPVVPEIRSLAVLPLLDFSGEPNRAHWADGITDELINNVAQISGVTVISRSSSSRFKGSAAPVSEIARQLNVDALIQGSVVVSEQKLGIRVQLVEPFADRHLWAASYEAELEDIVSLQRQIASAIARELSGRLTPAAEVRLDGAAPRVSPPAYEACMLGRLFWNRRTEFDMEKGIGRFEQAIALDPTYAEPYVGIADCLIMLGIFGLRRPCDAFPAAREAAEKALNLDSHNAAAQVSLGTILHMHYWEASGVEQPFKRALELNANSATAHQWYGSYLSGIGRNQEAIRLVEKARALDPLSLVMNAFLGLTYFKARQFEQAVHAARMAVELDPNNPFAHYILSRTLCGAGELQEAVLEAEAACRFSGNRLPFAAHVGYAYGRAGFRAKAEATLNGLEELRATRYVSAYETALIYLALEDISAAAAWLERSLEERAAKLTEILDPVFDGVRDQPVVHKIMCELRLTKH